MREIFNDRKSVPVAAGRLQRWAIFLAMYQYKIEYKKGSKMENADALPLPIENDIEIENVHEFTEELPVDRKVVVEALKKDKVLQLVIDSLRNGWKFPIQEKLKIFYNKRLMLHVENELLFYGNRMIIPICLKEKVLQLLHDTHIGIRRMKTAARMYVWWVNLDIDIENFAKCCEPCQLQQSSVSPTGLSKWEKTNSLFERIHMDFFHWKNETFLVIVDTFTRWLDVKAMKSTTAGNLIMELRVIFAYFGLPRELVADNGPPFNSNELRQFCRNNGIRYLNSPPYHPNSNGWAECGVRTVKQSLRKMFIESGGVKSSSLLVFM